MSKGLQAVAFALALPLVLVVAVVIGTSGDDGGAGAGNPAARQIDYESALAGAPPELAALHERANELIPGGLAGFERQLGALEGYPVVVNLWASWCGPCRAEFPFFQQLAAERGTEVAFLGVNSQDSDDAARMFLDEFPVPYPSISDPDREVWDDLLARGLPATAFYDAAGELVHLKQGEYDSEDELGVDLDRYAG